MSAERREGMTWELEHGSTMFWPGCDHFMNNDNHDSPTQGAYHQMCASPRNVQDDLTVLDLRRENVDLRRMLDYLLSYIAVVNSHAENGPTPAFVVYGESLEHDLAQSSVLNEIGYTNVTCMPIIDVIRRVVDKRESSIDARRSALSTSYSESSNHEAIPNVQPRSDRGV